MPETWKPRRGAYSKRGRVSQQGQLSLPLSWWVILGLLAALALSQLALKAKGMLLQDALEEKARIVGEYSAFKTGVRRIGEQAERDKAAEKLRQDKEHKDALKRISDR